MSQGAAVSSPPRHVTFVTGTLAEPSLRRVLADLAPPFAYDIAVLKITVAALMTTSWIARFLTAPAGTELIVIPGLSEGALAPIEARVGVPVARGPKELRDIPSFFGQRSVPLEYGASDIAIVAEINHAPRLSLDEILRAATAYRDAGADIIDIGCVPGQPFDALHDVVTGLRSAGMRVSIDTFDEDEIRAAVEAGAELVLSLNATNVGVAADLAGTGARAVVVPDLGGRLESIEPTLDALTRAGVPYLIDPILEPIGHGFMASLERYAEVRRRYPDAEMLMGIGNLTEMTAADSTGVNAILVAVCQELGVRTVLTTEVAPWARGAVRELDVARRIMRHAVVHHTVPKGMDTRLLTIKDAAVPVYPETDLRELQSRLTDPNFRIVADGDAITVFNHERFVRGTDADAIFSQLGVAEPSHAFYLGQELARASLARSLGKAYRQDSPLQWGYLTPADARPARHVRLTPPRKAGHA